VNNERTLASSRREPRAVGFHIFVARTVTTIIRTIENFDVAPAGAQRDQYLDATDAEQCRNRNAESNDPDGLCFDVGEQVEAAQPILVIGAGDIQQASCSPMPTIRSAAAEVRQDLLFDLRLPIAKRYSQPGAPCCR